MHSNMERDVLCQWFTFEFITDQNAFLLGVTRLFCKPQMQYQDDCFPVGEVEIHLDFCQVSLSFGTRTTTWNIFLAESSLCSFEVLF